MTDLIETVLNVLGTLAMTVVDWVGATLADPKFYLVAAAAIATAATAVALHGANQALGRPVVAIIVDTTELDELIALVEALDFEPINLDIAP